MSTEHPIHVFINRKKLELAQSVQTGAQLKNLAGIPLSDVLFLQRPGEDEVVPNDVAVTLKNGDHLHSQPPADYGSSTSALLDLGLEPDRVVVHPDVDGWHLAVIRDYQLPHGYRPTIVELLVKLPPTFPDAAPDMFWISPEVIAPNGNVPRATSTERLLGKNWQRFSWHLAPGSWKPGVSDLRDYLRCVHSRFLRLD